MLRLLSHHSIVGGAALFLVLVAIAMTHAGCAKALAAHPYVNGGTVPDLGADSELQPNAKTLYAMSKLLISQHKEDQGARILLRLISEHPGFLPAYCDLARLQVEQGRFDEALRELSKGLEIAPQDPVLLNNTGVCKLLTGDYTGALDNFTKAAASEPDNTCYRANKALALGMLGRYDDAMGLYAQLLPVESAAHNLYVIYETQGPLEPTSPSSEAEPEAADNQPNGGGASVPAASGGPE